MNGATALCMGLGILGAYVATPRRARTFPTNATPEQLAAAEALTRYHAEQLKKNPPPAITPPSSPSSPARPWRAETAARITFEPNRQYCGSIHLTGYKSWASAAMVRQRILNEPGTQWKAVAVWSDAAKVPEDWPGKKPAEPESGDRFWVLLVPAITMATDRFAELEELHSRAALTPTAVAGRRAARNPERKAKRAARRAARAGRRA